MCMRKVRAKCFIWQILIGASMSVSAAFHVGPIDPLRHAAEGVSGRSFSLSECGPHSVGFNWQQILLVRLC
jgi:hypothetical protein